MIALLVLLVFGGTFIVAALAVSIAAVMRPDGISDAEDAPALLKREQLSTLPGWRQILDRLDFTQFLKLRMEQAGVGWSVGRVTLAMLLLGAIFFAILFNLAGAPAGAAVAAACVGACTPFWAIQSIRSGRMRKLESQFPDALDSLARAMRAGHALSSGIAMLAAEVPAPLGPEFRKLADEHRLGLAWDGVLQNFSARVPILEVRLLVAALRIQTRTGGRLTEVLERLSENIREAAALRGDVRAISAQGRLTGAILTAMPLVVGGAMFLSNPSFIGVLFKDPTGKIMVWCAAGCLAAGHLVIRRIVTVKAPR